MIAYKKCTEVAMESIYEAFQIGFADYIIKFHISRDDFSKRFFQQEGNSLEYSIIALDGEKPIGLILGGMKNYEGIKTLRCGAMCIHPDYRRTGVSQKLFEYHRQIGIDQNCKRLFLEVIVGNDSAINFYKKLGYEKIYDLSYFTLKDVSKFKKISMNSLEIKKVSFKEIKSLESYIYDIHINWQNDFDYIDRVENQYHYGAYKCGSLIGALSVNKTGKIYFLWVAPKLRNSKAASSLISSAISELNLNQISTGFPNNASLEGFFRQIGFEKEKLSQYEMYLTL